jgi:hypothetical protein
MAKNKFLLSGYQWVWVLYIAVAVFTWQLKYFRNSDNNYLIFRQSYYHAKAEKNLYAGYPEEYGDIYYYGPVFPVIVWPSAALPHWAGFLLWELANAIAILLAVHLLAFTVKRKTQLLLLCAIEYANSIFYMQFNPAITAIIIFSFVFIERRKEQWATLFTVLGTLMKLYPIVGFVFFLFSKNKGKFILWSAIWSVVFLALPLLLSSPHFVFNSYHQWLEAVSAKSALNAGLNTSQDICLMGSVRRVMGDATISNMPFLLAGAVIFAIPLLRFSQFKSLMFRLQILVSALIMVVIFSTGAEHPTFIIAVAGVFIWMLMQDKPYTPFNITMLILVLVITGLGLTDAMPEFIRQPYIAKYSMKAWPVIIVWFKIAYELIFKDFVAAKAKIDTEYKQHLFTPQV